MFNSTVRKRPVATLLAATVLVTACNRGDNDNNVSPELPAKETIYTRLLVTDADGASVALVDPRESKATLFEGRHAGSNVYASRSGRFAIVANFANNLVQFFDTGIESHDEHAHVVGQPRWAPLTAGAPRPSHVYAYAYQGSRVAVFNDGDGSLSLVSEFEMAQEGAKPRHVKVDVPHHGAVASFRNHTFAVTQKDGTVSGSLPERVKIVNENGNVVKASTVATRGIHGEAGNGRIVLFGHRDGVLVVDQDGNQRSIANPASLGQNWLSTIVHDEVSDAFFGYNARGGVYRIDPATNQITPVLAGEQVAVFRVDNEGRELFMLLTDGTLRSFDGRTGAARSSVKVSEPIAADARVKPDVVVSKRFVYVTQPDTREIRVVQRGSMAVQPAIKLALRPAKLTLVGAQTDEEGH